MPFCIDIFNYLIFVRYRTNMKGSDTMPRGKAMRKPNGYGSVVKLSGNRRKPFEVRVNTKINEWGYPEYDVLNRFENRTDAEIALAEYNRSPFDVNRREITFKEVYEMWYDWKYNGAKKYSESSATCTKGAFNKCTALHDMKIQDIRTDDMQQILDDHTLSHAYMEHVTNLLHQVFKYSMEYDIIDKDYSRFIKITKEEDDAPGVPFSKDEINTLWQHVDDVPNCDIVLILIYTGWRISEILGMKTADIDLTEWTMKGGVKTKAGKNRIVPIHSGIKSLVSARICSHSSTFLYDMENDKPISITALRKAFAEVLSQLQINEEHTPHDCRHTFTSLLDSAGANDVCIDRLVGHASKTITKKTYTHKDIDELREAVEMIKIAPLE